MHDLAFLRDFVVLFAMAVFVAVVCHQVRLPGVVGFLLTGVIAGPHGLGLIHEQESVEMLAEIGVVLLLFTVGIEFSVERLYRIRSVIIFGGGLQVLLTAGLTFLIAFFALKLPPAQSVFWGMLVALSSTAVVLKLLAEKGEIDGPRGRIALGILIFQDLCIVPMMIATPFIAGNGDEAPSILATVAKAVVMVAGTIVCGRYAVPWVLGQVVRTRSREIFLLVTIVLCLGTAWLSALAGLSLALGAFLAGLIVSQSEYSHHVLGEIVPFRDAFNSLFFISIGMLLDLQTFDSPLTLLVGVALLILVKASVAAGVSIILGYGFRVSILVGFTLAQIGEFSFVLAKPGLEAGLLNEELYQLFLGAAVLTMILTPFMKAVAPQIATRLEPLVPRALVRLRRSASDIPSPHTLVEHVIILGFGVTGKNLARGLRSVDIPYVIVEMNPDTVATEKARGEPIFYGDVQKREVLEHAGLQNARVLVIAVSDAASVRQATHLARTLNPGLHIIVRTRYLAELTPLLELGASDVIPEEFETSLEIFSRTLRHLLVPRDIVERITREARVDGYGVLRNQDELATAQAGRLGPLQGAEIEIFRVGKGSALEDKTLAESDLRRQTGVSLLALRGGDDFELNPAADARLEAGHAVILFGSPEQIARAGELLRPPETVTTAAHGEPAR